STPRNGIKPLVIGLQRDKAELHQRINSRVTSMFESGLAAEFDHLLALGATESWPGMQGIGYREFFVARNTLGMGLDAVAELIRRNSRLYAKRQLTFFKSIPGVQWFHPDDEQGIKDVVEDYLTNPS
ncbi:MAG: tRNA (adenosine(37)-N6)-dimethylallyltransferase MiaA, partial [Spirochaetae bacterium HGW-Spirochaetae-8]